MTNKPNHTMDIKHHKNKETKKEKNDFKDDYVVKSMGAFGKWQFGVIILVSIGRVIPMWNILSIYFLTPPTEFLCKKFEGNTTIEAENSTCYDSCVEYEYFNSVFEDSLISDYGLICDNAWLASLSQTILMFGLVLGVSIFGWVSDRFGRSKAMISSGILALTLMFGAPFMPNFWTFTAIRFFIGVASGGIMAVTAVFTLEVVGPQHREFAGSIVLIPDDIAEATLALFAFCSVTWRTYLLSFSVASLAILLMLLFLPETPRWLMANAKAEKAVELMTRAATVNNLSTVDIRENVSRSLQELNLKENESPNLNYTDLFTSKNLIVITLVSSFVWFLTGLCYYGINQFTTALGSNIFLTVAIAGLIQLPASPLAYFCAKYFGRRKSTLISLSLVGLSMIILIFTPTGTWFSVLLGVTGVLTTGVSFCILYLYVTELYPTPVRNMGFSLSSSASKVGAMVAPFVANLRPFWLASLVFAVLPFFGAGVCLLLPETKGKTLSDTVDKS